MSGIRVIAGFPGVGKSFLFGGHSAAVSDSDSSKFPKADFPANYINHIRHLIDDTNLTVLVSSHKAVRDALIANGIQFLLVYPKPELKVEYLERYRRRGSPDSFLSLLDVNFESWVAECRDLKSDLVVRAELSSGEYLSDVICWE